MCDLQRRDMTDGDVSHCKSQNTHQSESGEQIYTAQKHIDWRWNSLFICEYNVMCAVHARIIMKLGIVNKQNHSTQLLTVDHATISHIFSFTCKHTQKSRSIIRGSDSLIYLIKFFLAHNNSHLLPATNDHRLAPSSLWWWFKRVWKMGRSQHLALACHQHHLSLRVCEKVTAAFFLFPEESDSVVGGGQTSFLERSRSLAIC